MRENETHPKRTPPKATKRPIIMAGAAEPTASSGFFNAKPIAQRIGWDKEGNRSKISNDANGDDSIGECCAADTLEW
jgi:hypothetical protein